MDSLTNKIIQLKKEKNVAILAHYYVQDEVQALADYVGDSFFLSKKALDLDENIVIFCGVSFMAETAKLLSYEKTILFPNLKAKCPMAEMADKESVLKFKENYPEAKIISYVNSSTEIKSISDACCTSSNAYSVVKNIDADEIVFVPDKNLAQHVQSQVSNKKIIPWAGSCPYHDQLRAKDVSKFLKNFPRPIKVLVHPECRKEVRDLADYIGSTGNIINYVEGSSCKDFLILTEEGILYELKNKFPDKSFHQLNIFCPPMKAISLKDVYHCLVNMDNEIRIDKSLRDKAREPLDKMLELSK